MKKFPFALLIVLTSIIFILYGSILKIGSLLKITDASDLASELFSEENMAIAYAVHDIEENFSGRLEGDESNNYEIGGFDPASYSLSKSDSKNEESWDDTWTGNETENSDEGQKEPENLDKGDEKGTESDDVNEGDDSAPEVSKVEDEDTQQEMESPQEAEDGEVLGDSLQENSNSDDESGEQESNGNLEEAEVFGLSQNTALLPGDESFSGNYGGFVQADLSYLTGGDALLIGDSRQQGFGLYSGIKGMTVYADKGNTVFSVFDKAFIDLGAPYGKVTLPQALSLEPGKYKKIYVMFGINEMGWGNSETLKEAYYKLVDMLKSYEPNAVIFLESILPVTERKASQSKYFRSERIVERNEYIKEVARDEHVAYLDLHSVYCNEEGFLPKEYAADGVHLKAQYFSAWTDFLLSHALPIF
ncbi:MAG: hypothetical protein J6P05_01695 [Lachnospiraceae bacterium]|nr:hypothetical protein [Lachnospiraceae bacterium]